MTRRTHRTVRSTVRFRNLAAASVMLCAALALSACSSSDSNGEAVPQTSSASPTSSASEDPTEVAKKEAIAAYQGYWRQMERLYADRSGAGADLGKYAASAALKNAEADAKHAHERGRINIGAVTVIAPTVTKFDAEGGMPNATISSCLDVSKWQTVDAETKKPVSLPSNRLTKYLIVSVVEKRSQGWRVIRDEPQGKSC
ncbi:hypothetical protein [Streptomyces sp. NPDC093984]|uniref:hypothetical protein n=1 Tax=Streptomyces sp. NPDC093984 TaxID=3366052 RepID=UPI00380B3EA1